jgi:hypothetical protein
MHMSAMSLPEIDAEDDPGALARSQRARKAAVSR